LPSNIHSCFGNEGLNNLWLYIQYFFSEGFNVKPNCRLYVRKCVFLGISLCNYDSLES
jgi:hypothetical protein